jgi:anti-sigma28 factor (negative regulator of flagellin synthesis)
MQPVHCSGTKEVQMSGDVLSAEAPPIARAERVARLRAQYLDGTYHIDPVRVSAKIIEHHLKDGSSK